MVQFLRNEFTYFAKARSIHDSMNIPKIELSTYIYILYYQSSINFHLTWVVFQIFLIKSDIM